MSDALLEGLKIGGAAIAFGVGLLQYVKGQRWRRAEFIANEVKEFNADAAVRDAKLMLDYTQRYIDLFPEREAPADRRVLVTGEMLAAALAPHAITPAYSQEEARIRDTFDEFLGRLERFENFIDANLVTKEECQPYLEYWLDILGDNTEEGRRYDIVDALWVYIDTYEYTGVQSLLRRFGYEIAPPKHKTKRSRVVVEKPKRTPNAASNADEETDNRDDENVAENAASMKKDEKL